MTTDKDNSYEEGSYFLSGATMALTAILLLIHGIETYQMHKYGGRSTEICQIDPAGDLNQDGIDDLIITRYGEEKEVFYGVKEGDSVIYISKEEMSTREFKKNPLPSTKYEDIEQKLNQ